MVTGSEFRCELVENVSVVSEAWYEHKGPPSASPVEYLQSHIVLDGDELNVVWGRVMPRSGFLRAN
jgi:hypothetical protein